MSTLMSVDDGFIPGSTKEDKQNTLKEWYLLNLNHYYQQIEYCTFKTIFIPFKPEIATIWQKINRRAQLTSEETELWNKAIMEPLDKAIKTFPNGAFVKLSTRSPKDAVDKSLDRLKTHLTFTGSESLNETYIMLRRGFFKTLCVTNAQEAIQIMSLSARIISDLIRALENQEIWDLELVVREFVQFDIINEFRGFYYDGKLTAVSQYDINCHFPVDRQEIETRIMKFMEIFPVKTNCIIDFVITKDQIYIVELNPFSQSSGCALFNWIKDQEVLKNGPFEIRTLDQPRDDKYMTAVMSTWKSLIQGCTEQPSNCILN